MKGMKPTLPAGTRGAGREFSHGIPDRILKRTGSNWVRNTFGRSRFNGNYVTPARHALHDPFRYITGGAGKLPAALQQLDRVPRIYYGAAAGGVLGTVGASVASDCECQ
jgi:hypothetical protein